MCALHTKMQSVQQWLHSRQQKLDQTSLEVLALIMKIILILQVTKYVNLGPNNLQNSYEYFSVLLKKFLSLFDLTELLLCVFFRHKKLTRDMLQHTDTMIIVIGNCSG